MDTTTIVIFFAVIVLLSIAAIVISQAREKAKIERARRAKALEDSYRASRRLLEELPPQYLTKDLKSILLMRGEEVCRDAESLKGDLPVGKWRDELKTRRQQMDDNADERSPQRIDSPARAAEVKGQLQLLFKMIEGMQKRGRLDSKLARHNLKLVLFLIHKTQADLHVSQAREHTRQKQFRKAIHAYHLASTELGKAKDNPMALKAIKSFRVRIKELEDLANGAAPKTQDEEKHRLNKEWDSFLHDEEWKKKADYDD
ncbi:hypothetical protein RE428_21160 [Marinobacter nanhaiticus D15-8W]|uniref:Uncharacterized protein n=1 Tax=Marinobacter nanhaiticus D15-8W TaxID=626887 RepID=N6VUD4_9GAMM|nr:hypothetical protein [Marinobacter nanhaiticus]ENO13725.1 hypothetical protein J057_20055 [Marinobacter nanhaiticus D15-8W]BES71098.1 hypothetical protein RE428_21160 [Marinobacter nanhaiticus D15-8W]